MLRRAFELVGVEFIEENGGGLEDRTGRLDHAVQGRRHPALDGMKHLPLHLDDDLAGVALVPVSVEVFGSWTIRLAERSSGSTSPRFSRHSRTRATGSSPMMIRASEPPMRARRSTGFSI